MMGEFNTCIGIYIKFGIKEMDSFYLDVKKESFQQRRGGIASEEEHQLSFFQMTWCQSILHVIWNQGKSG